jgi:hypothetical protein
MELPDMKHRTFLLSITLALAATGLAATAVQAQFGGIGGVVRNLPVNTPAVPNVLSGPQPVSTNIKDAVWGDPSKDGFTPPGRVQPLSGLARSGTGGFVLQAGYYSMLAQSYCLHAGTHGPGGGDGYLYAPVKGSAKDTVETILRNSNAHPEIEQHDIQLLLWAIVAKAKFEDLDPRLKLVAAQLLSKKQLAGLNRSALSALSSANNLVGLPGPLRTVLEAESRMRSMLTLPGSSYSDIERVAVLGGAAPRGEGSVDTPATRWNQHPDGYWVRYRPNGYSNTNVEVWVPPGSAAVGKSYEPWAAVVVPGNTSRQRLAQSARSFVR